MKYSVSARQPDQILQQAEEIYVDFKDRDILLDYEDKGLLDKKIVLAKDELINPEKIDWQYLEMLNSKFKEFTFLTSSLALGNTALSYNINYGWLYPVVTYYDLLGVYFAGANEIIIGTPLTFDLPNVRKMIGDDIILRTTCNSAYEDYMHHFNGICGFYIRPEDIPVYEEYINVITFDAKSLNQERRLFDIYHNDKNWPGNLNLLIKNLNADVDNRGIVEEFAKTRIKCQQKCMMGKPCRSCIMIFDYVNTIDRNKFHWDIDKRDWVKDEEI